MKHSIQRELIYQTILTHPVHPTTDDIFQLVKEEMPNIGIATVYRNVNVLSEMHKIRRLPGEDGIDRFDAIIHDHPHFYCTSCKKFQDYPMPSYEEITKSIWENQEFHVNDINFIVSGICKSCQ